MIRIWIDRADNGMAVAPAEKTVADRSYPLSGRVYWYTINVLSRPPAIEGAGYYEDTYVKTADGWRMKSRKSTRGWTKRMWPATAANNR